MDRNYLRGVEGDQINAVLCACGYNMRKLLKVFFLSDFLRGFIRSFLIKKPKVEHQTRELLLSDNYLI